LRGRHPGR